MITFKNLGTIRLKHILLGFAPVTLFTFIIIYARTDYANVLTIPGWYLGVTAFPICYFYYREYMWVSRTNYQNIWEVISWIIYISFVTGSILRSVSEPDYLLVDLWKSLRFFLPLQLVLIATSYLSVKNFDITFDLKNNENQVIPIENDSNTQLDDPSFVKKTAIDALSKGKLFDAIQLVNHYAVRSGQTEVEKDLALAAASWHQNKLDYQNGDQPLENWKVTQVRLINMIIHIVYKL